MEPGLESEVNSGRAGPCKPGTPPVRARDSLWPTWSLHLF